MIYLFKFACYPYGMTMTDPDQIKIFVKNTIAIADLTKAIEAGEEKIEALSGISVNDWTPTMSGYGQLQLIGSMFGAWTILFGWDDKMYGAKAKELRTAYEEEVKQFQKMPIPSEQGNPNVVIAEGDYSHYKLNPEGTRPFLSSY
jgi:hypothetical protein